MDKIQAFLITAGKKDLAQDYFKTYWHISNSGVTFSIIDDFGPTLVIESSAFGNMTTTQKFHTDKKSLLYLRSVIDHALTKDFSKDYCEKAHVQDYEKKPKTEIFLGGDCTEMWRPAIIEKFPEIDFIDPYDKNWVAEENIYTELGDAISSDIVVFYKGGAGTEKEKKLFDKIGKPYKSFDKIEDLMNFIGELS